MDATVNAVTNLNVKFLHCFGAGPSWAGGNAPTNILDWDLFITNFVTRYHTKIKYLETWNESAAGEGFYTGTTAMLVQMEHDLYTITKSIDPTVTVLTPDATGGKTVVWNFYTNYFAAGGTNCDAIAFHGYCSMTGIAGNILYPEEIIGIVTNLQTAMKAYGQGSKPIFCTEGDWGTEGPNANCPTTNDAVAFMARHYLLMWSLGVSSYAWYDWENNNGYWQYGEMWDPNNGGLNAAGLAYQQLYYWMVGAQMSQPYTHQGSLYTCGFTRPGGYQALAVWYTNRASTSTFTVPSGYIQYRDLAGNLYSISGSTVTIGIEPILLENMNEPIFSGLTSHTNTYGAASVTLTGTVTSYGTNLPSGTVITVTVNGSAQTTTVSDAMGDFSINYNTTGLPASPTPYTVTCSNAAAGSLPAATDTSSTLTVNPRPVVLTGTRLYDGTTNAAAAILSVTNLVGSDSVTLSGSVGLAGANAGAQAITSFSGLTLGGGSATNYTLTGASGTVTITPQTPMFSGLTSPTITYGASNVTLTGTVSTNSLYPPSGTVITVTINGSAQTTTISDATGDFTINDNIVGLPANVYPVTSSSAVTANFNAATNTSTTLTINPRPVVLTGTRAYDGTATAAAAILSVVNLVGSDSVTLSGSVGLAGANAGAQAITSFSGLTLGGGAVGDYTLTGASGTVTITEMALGGLSVSGSQFIWSYPTVSGQTYQLEYTTDLSSGAWLPVGDPVPGTGAPLSVTNSISSSMQMFFRLSITNSN